MRGKWALFAGVAILAAAGAGAYSWYRSSAPPPKAAVQTAPAVGPEVSLAGKIVAKTLIPVAAPIKGVVEQYHVEVGQEVFEGQILARIKSEALDGSREAAQLAAESAKTKVNNIEYAITAARLEASRASADAARARGEFDRLDKLFQRQKMQVAEGALPRQVFDKTQKEYASAKTESENLQIMAQSAEKRIEQLQNELDAAKKLLDEKNEDLEEAKTQIASGEVLAPAAGVVTSRRGDAGEEVDPSVKDLIRIATDLSTLEVVVEPGSAELAKIKPGQPAMVRIAELPDQALEGAVKRVENGQVYIEFANPSPEVKPGLTAQATIQLR